MKDEQAYPSLSFFKILLDSSASQISIPPNFIRRFGERMMGNCKLEADGKWYNVKCEKISTNFYFTQGWHDFVEANGLESGFFLVFRSNQETSSFSVSVFDSSQTSFSKQHLPGSFPASENNRARVKEEPVECPDKEHLPKLVPASNKLAPVKEEPSLTSSSAETDSGNPTKPYIKCEIEDDGDDFGNGHDDYRDVTGSSLSFSATFKTHNWVAIPKDFAKRSRIANHKRVMLKDNGGKKWSVDLKPINDGKLKLTEGWEEVKRALRVDSNVTCIFTLEKRCSNVLNVRVKRGRGRPRNQ